MARNKKYINGTGIGFKKLPISPSIKVPMQESWEY